MDSPRDSSSTGGEFEIEKVPAHELEIKQKKLLPVFDHFHSTKATLEDRYSQMLDKKFLHILLSSCIVHCLMKVSSWTRIRTCDYLQPVLFPNILFYIPKRLI